MHIICLKGLVTFFASIKVDFKKIPECQSLEMVGKMVTVNIKFRSNPNLTYLQLTLLRVKECLGAIWKQINFNKKSGREFYVVIELVHVHDCARTYITCSTLIM